MRLTLFAAGLLFAFNAQACPDFNGTYEFQKNPSEKLIVQQQGCSTVSITVSWNRYTATLLTDGQHYESQYDAKGNSKANIPVTDKSTRFDRASFANNKLLWNQFDGEFSQCKAQYSFTDFKCKMFEHSLRYDSDLKAYVWTQVGFWRSYDGSYGNDEFALSRVR